jgi:hypothetical protein
MKTSSAACDIKLGLFTENADEVVFGSNIKVIISANTGRTWYQSHSAGGSTTVNHTLDDTTNPFNNIGLGNTSAWQVFSNLIFAIKCCTISSKKSIIVPSI